MATWVTPIDIEGTPDNAVIYAKIQGHKCGLQWSSVKGKVKGISHDERIAKFDCNDKADHLIVEYITRIIPRDICFREIYCNVEIHSD